MRADGVLSGGNRMGDYEEAPARPEESHEGEDKEAEERARKVTVNFHTAPILSSHNFRPPLFECHDSGLSHRSSESCTFVAMS